MRWRLICCVGVALMVAGCVESGEDAPTTSTVTPESLPAVDVAPGNVAPGSDPAPLSPNPGPPPPPPGDRPLAAPSLIPATSPTARLPQVEAGRPDPFSAIASAPILSANPAPVPPAAPVTLVPPPPTVLNVPPPELLPAPIDVNQVPVAPLVPGGPGGSGSISPSVSALPRTDLVISGVVQIGDRLSAIVELPGGGSRYVNEGDRLANGRIVVRRIEMNPNQEPRVILEQDGVEVVRMVASGSIGSL